jgi:hypothetical protein
LRTAHRRASTPTQRLQPNLFAQVTETPTTVRTTETMVFFCSFDTEALNRQLANINETDLEFENVFSSSSHKNVNVGVQQLYIIGNMAKLQKLSHNIFFILKIYLCSKTIAVEKIVFLKVYGKK